MKNIDLTVEFSDISVKPEKELVESKLDYVFNLIFEEIELANPKLTLQNLN